MMKIACNLCELWYEDATQGKHDVWQDKNLTGAMGDNTISIHFWL